VVAALHFSVSPFGFGAPLRGALGLLSATGRIPTSARSGSQEGEGGKVWICQIGVVLYEGGDVDGEHRLGPLASVRAQTGHRLVLSGGLDPFADDSHLEAVRQLDDRGHDHLAVGVGGEVSDELLVDLDRVDREGAQVASDE
jgi:hypothetical protein